jgi:hypothetical protein
MFLLNMLLTSLPIHQYFLCQSSDIPPYMEQPIEPHQGPYTGGNIDPISKHLIQGSDLNPTSLVKSSCCYSVSQHLSLSPVSSSVSVSATTEFVITAIAETLILLLMNCLCFSIYAFLYVHAPLCKVTNVSIMCIMI